MTRVEQFERIRRDRRLEGLSIRELARKHKVHRRVVRQALASAVPPPRKETPRTGPVMGSYEETIRGWLIADQKVPRKQRHTARRVWTRLVAKEGASVAESTVRETVRRIRTEIGEPHGGGYPPELPPRTVAAPALRSPPPTPRRAAGQLRSASAGSSRTRSSHGTSNQRQGPNHAVA